MPLGDGAATSRKKRFYLTVDVDWVPGSESGLAGLYDFCERHGIPASYFFAGRFAREYPHTVAEAVRRGHIIGTHGWEHGQLDKQHEENFRTASVQDQGRWIGQSTQAVLDACGTRPRAFRAPNLQIGEATLQVLEEHGYTIDSSVPARRLSATYGSLNPPKYYMAPLSAYHPSRTFLGRRGSSPILEVPPSAFFVPLNMSALRVLGWSALAWATRRVAARSSDVVFFAHPSEFVPASEQHIPDINPARHKKGIGPENFTLLERYMSFVRTLGLEPAHLGTASA